MTPHELSANLEWCLHPHELADEDDGSYGAAGFDDELVAGLQAEAGRPLTERELRDACDYFPRAFRHGDEWSCALWKVDYNPTWHLSTPEAEDDNVFFPESLERQVERSKDELAAKLTQALLFDFSGDVASAEDLVEPIMRAEPAVMGTVAHEARRSQALNHPAAAEESSVFAIGIIHSGYFTIPHPPRPRRAPGFDLDVAMSGGLGHQAAGAYPAKGLATWMALSSQPDHDAELASFAASIEQIGDAQLRASLRRELGRIRALARARRHHPAQVQVRVVRQPTPPLILKVEAAGGKPGRYAPLD